MSKAQHRRESFYLPLLAPTDRLRFTYFEHELLEVSFICSVPNSIIQITLLSDRPRLQSVSFDLPLLVPTDRLRFTYFEHQSVLLTAQATSPKTNSLQRSAGGKKLNRHSSCLSPLCLQYGNNVVAAVTASQGAFIVGAADAAFAAAAAGVAKMLVPSA